MKFIRSLWDQLQQSQDRKREESQILRNVKKERRRRRRGKTPRKEPFRGFIVSPDPFTGAPDEVFTLDDGSQWRSEINIWRFKVSHPEVTIHKSGQYYISHVMVVQDRHHEVNFIGNLPEEEVESTLQTRAGNFYEHPTDT